MISSVGQLRKVNVTPLNVILNIVRNALNACRSNHSSLSLACSNSFAHEYAAPTLTAAR
ncbi:hypothetical protein PROFUN_13232 [Planoprotostelium fungivorum]|uniref:Uncharacterized protein n=1 Tax=Planoprotostelium fungivorum TaxID=1890364 RepID=A0A2P6N4S0_9EUKA|nr:hypothetical protein PROFUN_13232 [Planoprotostelium fungivorum]